LNPTSPTPGRKRKASIEEPSRQIRRSPRHGESPPKQ